MEKLLSHCHLLEGNASIFNPASFYGWMNGKLIVVLKFECQKTRETCDLLIVFNLLCCILHLESLSMPLHAIYAYF